MTALHGARSTLTTDSCSIGDKKDSFLYGRLDDVYWAYPKFRGDEFEILSRLLSLFARICSKFVHWQPWLLEVLLLLLSFRICNRLFGRVISSAHFCNGISSIANVGLSEYGPCMSCFVCRRMATQPFLRSLDKTCQVQVGKKVTALSCKVPGRVALIYIEKYNTVLVWMRGEMTLINYKTV